MGHAHHGHRHGSSSERRISTAFFLNLAFTLLEIAGGLWTNSMAILSDALHDLGDSIALGLTWRFARISKRTGDEVFTFGYRRFSLLGALVMSIVLFAGGVVVLFEAIPRILSPQATNAPGMFALAIVGVLVNGIAALRMRGGRSVGERIVTWHFVEDVLGWVAVLIASVVMWFRDVPILDPILSVAITAYVLWNVGKRLKETLTILLQGVPTDIDIEHVEDVIRRTPGVCDVHHTHIWTQDGEHHVLTAHIVVDNADSYEDVAAVRRAIKDDLRGFGIRHATIEVEADDGSRCPDENGECRTC
ncbi:MAG: cation diffusion facilitator family transporter [Candidatus Bipolaricaulia bacterium]